MFLLNNEFAHISLIIDRHLSLRTCRHKIIINIIIVITNNDEFSITYYPNLFYMDKQCDLSRIQNFFNYS